MTTLLMSSSEYMDMPEIVLKFLQMFGYKQTETEFKTLLVQ